MNLQVFARSLVLWLALAGALYGLQLAALPGAIVTALVLVPLPFLEPSVTKWMAGWKRFALIGATWLAVVLGLLGAKAFGLAFVPERAPDGSKPIHVAMQDGDPVRLRSGPFADALDSGDVFALVGSLAGAAAAVLVFREGFRRGTNDGPLREMPFEAVAVTVALTLAGAGIAAHGHRNDLTSCLVVAAMTSFQAIPFNLICTLVLGCVWFLSDGVAMLFPAPAAHPPEKTAEVRG